MQNTEKRRYRSGKRTLAAEQTRLRIIEAARALLSESGYPNVSLEELADRAGVSRQTIYVQFGSKRGVLQALAQHIEREAFGTDDIVEGARHVHDPIRNLSNGIGNMMEFYRDNSLLLRTFQAQAAYDPDFRSVWAQSNARSRAAIRIVVDLLVERGQLADGWTADEAADWLWSVLAFGKYDLLVVERGWTPERLRQRILQMVNQMLLADGTSLG